LAQPNQAADINGTSDETKRSKRVKTKTSLAGTAGWPNDPRGRQRKAEREKVVSPSIRQRAGCFHLVFAGGVLGCRLMFPSAQAAELTSGHYRSFQEDGLEARVDLASQVLQLSVPEEKQYVWQHLETNLRMR